MWQSDLDHGRSFEQVIFELKFQTFILGFKLWEDKDSNCFVSSSLKPLLRGAVSNLFCCVPHKKYLNIHI